MSGLVFESLPPSRSPSSWDIDHVAALKQLQDRPGEWARLITYGSRQSANSTAHRIKSGAGRLRALYGCEAAVRDVDGGYGVYVRWPVQDGAS